MPRTKASKSRKSKQEESFLLDFKRKSALEIKKIEADLMEAQNKALAKIDAEFNRFPPEIRDLELGQIIEILNEESSSEEEEEVEEQVSVVEVSDARYATNTSNKSAVRIQNKQGKFMKHLLVPANMYSHTPKNKKMKVVPITPKVGPNFPVPVTRFARTGETVLSMTGSPIHAPGMSTVTVPNISVPLDNGDVINIASTASLRQSLLPTLDPRTVDQLRRLKEQIEKFLPS